jgi:GNAT superfamily N-acetyltransferase
MGIGDGDVIRTATPADIPTILALIRDLATFEREPDAVVATEAGLHDVLFGPEAFCCCHLAEIDGEIVGFALWFRNFSTWLGRPGIYLEDLYVQPAARGRGVGKALLEALVEVARERGYGRVEWAVLDWNTSAHAFYRGLGAVPNDEWTTWRLTLVP